MKNVLVVCQDLIFSTKIRGTASELGIPCQVAPTGSSLSSPTEVSLVLVDLNAPQTEASDLKNLRTNFPAPARLIAFGSHVEVARLRLARDAGFDRVLARSEFTRDLASILSET